MRRSSTRATRKPTQPEPRPIQHRALPRGTVARRSARVAARLSPWNGACATEPGTFYAIAGGALYARSDGDASWTAISGGALDFDVGSLAIAADGTPYVATVRGPYRYDSSDRSWQRQDTGIRGRRVLDLAVDPSDPDVVLAATDGGGVQRSADFGRTWSPWSGEALTNAVVDGVVVDPVDPLRVLASACGGVLSSNDGGRSWPPAGVQGMGCDRTTYNQRLEPSRFAFAPSDPDLVLAALGNLYRSTDGGRTWTYVPISPNGEVQCHGFRAVAVDPLDSLVVYTIETIGGPAKSIDGGASFPSATCALIAFEGPAAIAIDPADPATIYASFTDGLVKSEDRGETWVVQPGIDRVWSLAFDAADPTTLYAGADDGVFVTHDGAATWQPVGEGLPSAPVYALAIDPRDGRTLLAGTHGAGVQRLRLE